MRVAVSWLIAAISMDELPWIEDRDVQRCKGEKAHHICKLFGLPKTAKQASRAVGVLAIL